METDRGYFKLSKCRKLSVRHRTLCGRTAYYHTYFEPRGLDKHDRRVAIDSFKHPKTKLDKRISDEMVEYAVSEFLKMYKVDDFDIMIGIPSSSNIVSKIIAGFREAGFNKTVLEKSLKKTRIRNIKLKTDVLDRENSLKTKLLVPKSYTFIRKNYYDKVSKVSLFPTRFRRYFENFLKFTDWAEYWLEGDFKNKSVLVIDDTFGEGLTMCEVSRMLEPYTTQVLGFSVMKDMSS